MIAVCLIEIFPAYHFFYLSIRPNKIISDKIERTEISILKAEDLLDLPIINIECRFADVSAESGCKSKNWEARERVVT